MGSEEGINGKVEIQTRYRNGKSENKKEERDEENTYLNGIKPTNTQFSLGGFGNLLFIAFLIVGVLALIVSCQKDHCSISRIPPFPTDISSYFDLQVSVIYLGWFLFQVCLSILIPTKTVEGKRLRNGQRLQYRFNGFMMLSVNIVILFVLAWFKFPLQVLGEKTLEIYSIALVCSLAIAAFLYLKSLIQKIPRSQLNSNASGGGLHDFIAGREINPCIQSLNIKLFLIQCNYVGMAAIDFILFVKELESAEQQQRNSATLLAILIQIFWAADALFFEESLIVSRTLTGDGVGFKFVYGCLVLMPLTMILPHQYIANNHLPPDETLLIIVFFLFLAGYFIHRASNGELHTFYVNPDHTDFEEAEIIMSESGERLLVGGWWEWVRHPNYLGYIIVQIAYCMVGGFDDFIPFSFAIIMTVHLIYRAYANERQSRLKYGKAWDQYREKVGYRLLRYIV